MNMAMEKKDRHTLVTDQDHVSGLVSIGSPLRISIGPHEPNLIPMRGQAIAVGDAIRQESMPERK
jgi:hypothetical protein